MEQLDIEKFSPTKTELLTLAEEARKLTITGIDDKAGYSLVQKKRMELKSARVKIAKAGKEAREEALSFQKKVIAYEKELIGIIEPVEEDLKAKQDAIDEEKAKIERLALIPSRKDNLAKIGLTFDDEFLIGMDIPTFQDFYNQKKTEYLEKKEADMRAEQERIEIEKRKIEDAKHLEATKKEAEKQAHEKAMRDAELAKVRAEQEKLAAVEAERKKAEIEKQRIIAEQQRKEQERLNEEARVRREQEAQKQAEKQAQEKLEKEKKYQAFLKKNKYKETDDFYLQKRADKIVLYGKLDEFNI